MLRSIRVAVLNLTISPGRYAAFQDFMSRVVKPFISEFTQLLFSGSRRVSVTVDATSAPDRVARGKTSVYVKARQSFLNAKSCRVMFLTGIHTSRLSYKLLLSHSTMCGDAV